MDLLSEEVADKEEGEAILFKEIQDAAAIKLEMKVALLSMEKVLSMEKTMERFVGESTKKEGVA